MKNIKNRLKETSFDNQEDPRMQYGTRSIKLYSELLFDPKEASYFIEGYQFQLEQNLENLPWNEDPTDPTYFTLPIIIEHDEFGEIENVIEPSTNTIIQLPQEVYSSLEDFVATKIEEDKRQAEESNAEYRWEQKNNRI